MTLEKLSPCKVNLLLNILCKRPDGFHELETVIQPLPLCDFLRFTRRPRGIGLSCSEPALPTDSRNLVYRAAALFLQTTGITEGVALELDKKVPLAAGLGGGSSNAANTLLGLNELFGSPLTPERLHTLAAALGSDVPFFLQSKPALGTGRGEQVQPLEPFSALKSVALLLIHPGFGISTAWAYQALGRFPTALNGQPGRAAGLVEALRTADLKAAASLFYNSLEAPGFEKYPVLALFQDYLREHGAAATLMSGSGSTTFAIVPNRTAAENLADKFRTQFGDSNWLAIVSL